MKDEIAYIPLENLIFDPENPRLPPEIARSNEQRIIDYMLREANLLELMQAIAQNGYFRSEPLLVVPEKPGKFTVVEGNRRLAALKLLANPALASVKQNSVKEIAPSEDKDLKSIPCITHKKRDDVLDYLGYRHITGVKSWGSLEKARYLKQLFEKIYNEESPENNYRILAKMIGSRADHVGRLLSSLKLYELANENAYFKIEIEPKDIDFSILYTAIGYKDIREYIGLKHSGDINHEHIKLDNLGFIFECLYDPKSKRKIDDSRKIADLNSVIKHSDALEEYKKGMPLSEAIYYTDAPLNTFIIFLDKATDSLRNARNCLDRMKDDVKNGDVHISEMHIIENIARSIRKTLQEDN